MKTIKAEKARYEDVGRFLEHGSAIDGVTRVECGPSDDAATVAYRTGGTKVFAREPFMPFCWAKAEAGRAMFGGDRKRLAEAMREAGISASMLATAGHDGKVVDRMSRGYCNLWRAERPMSMREFEAFFRAAGVPLRQDGPAESQPYIVLTPEEQHMIRTKKRPFGGTDTYRGLRRLFFEAGDGYIAAVCGGEEHVFDARSMGCYRAAAAAFFDMIDRCSPDVISGYGCETGGWDAVAAGIAREGGSMETDSVRPGLPYGVRRTGRSAVLKVGGGTERYEPTSAWGSNITDALFAIKRAQALDSDMRDTSLEYAGEYLGISKGGGAPDGPVGRLRLAEKVEEELNESGFAITKMLPVNFSKACTMGTAAIWRYLMLAWSYEKGLGVPEPDKGRRFVGGLSKILRTGFVKDVVKFDYTSMYPSIALTFDIRTDVDISGAMPVMLETVLSKRESFKARKIAGEEALESAKAGTSEYESAYADYAKSDKIQRGFKVVANAYFGALGSKDGIFPWADMDCAEEITCCGRQMLRLMLRWFTDRGYEGVVCDSVTGDTPLFARRGGEITIMPIEDAFEEGRDAGSGRAYDTSAKPYQVLGRSGWADVGYVYRHSTDKATYRVEDGGALVDATEDHSLFDSDGREVRPADIHEDTRLERYAGADIYMDFNTIDVPDADIKAFAAMTSAFGRHMRGVPDEVLNASVPCKELFLRLTRGTGFSVDGGHSKTLVAGMQFIRECVNRNR